MMILAFKCRNCHSLIAGFHTTYRSQHSAQGHIKRCHTEDLVTEYRAICTKADFSRDWFRKLPSETVIPPQRESASRYESTSPSDLRVGIVVLLLALSQSNTSTSDLALGLGCSASPVVRIEPYLTVNSTLAAPQNCAGSGCA